jgi:hypothetical protein
LIHFSVYSRFLSFFFSCLEDQDKTSFQQNYSSYITEANEIMQQAKDFIQRDRFRPDDKKSGIK